MSNTYSFNEFKDHYKKYGKTLNQMNRPKNTLNDSQLTSLFNKYLKQEEKKFFKIRKDLAKSFVKVTDEMIEEAIDQEWEDVKSDVFKRDDYHCQLLSSNLTDSEKMDFNINAPSELLCILDPCHIFGKGAYPHMKYDKDNIVTMNRFSHSCIDQCCNPITGKQINDGERERWWVYIIGEKRYSKLKDKAYKKE